MNTLIFISGLAGLVYNNVKFRQAPVVYRKNIIQSNGYAVKTGGKGIFLPAQLLEKFFSEVFMAAATSL